MSYTGKQFYQCYYTTLEGDKTNHKCRECERTLIANTKQSGYQNLINHAKGHAGWEDKMKQSIAALERSGSLGQYITKKVSPKAMKYYGWLDWCIMGNEPFIFVENNLVRKYSKLDPISVKTLMKYMEKTGVVVKTKIREILPKSFGLMLDGINLSY